MGTRMTVNGIVAGLKAEHIHMCHQTIRTYGDKGWIECGRDHRGWRYFPDGEAAIAKIMGMLDGTIKPEDDDECRTG